MPKPKLPSTMHERAVRAAQGVANLRVPSAAAQRLAREQLAERQARERQQMQEARLQVELAVAERRLQQQLLRGPWAAPGRQNVDEAAQAKATQTLTRFLSEEQRRSYRENAYFLCVGSEGNTYRIETNRTASGNVIWVRGEKDKPPFQSLGGQYCAYPMRRGPDGRVLPREDQFLGQMLQLVTDENSYLAQANVFAGTYPPTFRHPDPAHRGSERCGCDFCLAARLEYGMPRPVQHVILGGREVEVRFRW